MLREATKVRQQGPTLQSISLFFETFLDPKSAMFMGIPDRNLQNVATLGILHIILGSYYRLFHMIFDVRNPIIL